MHLSDLAGHHCSEAQTSEQGTATLYYYTIPIFSSSTKTLPPFPFHPLAAGYKRQKFDHNKWLWYLIIALLHTK